MFKVGAAFTLAGILQSTTQAANNQSNAAPDNTPRGGQIAAKLGGGFPALAARYGKDPAKLAEHCAHDDDMALSPAGHLHVTCSALAIPVGAGGGGGAGVQSFPPEQTFFLHSRPGAAKVIYLDFDGETTSGTFWNSDYNNGQDIVTPAYDTDGNPGAFSATELANIQTIWQHVTEDFAAFDVDVTTEDPGIEALRKTSPTDENYGQRVILGGNGSWYGPFGGVAEIGSFNLDTDVPCFVFPANLSNGAVKPTAEASSHEAGHTLGLLHDGTVAHDGQPALSYYYGHGNWAPIMGVGYDRPVTQWSKGDYPFANNQEDDLAVMQTYGISLLPDQHGDSLASATALSGYSTTTDSVIESRTDSDWFSFTTGGGNIFLGVDGNPVSPNLDVELSLYNSGGTLLTTVAPGTSLGAELATNLAAGTYFVKLDGIGTGSPLTAYDDYSSIGQYHLTTLTVPTSGVPPIAVADSSAPLSGPAQLTVNFSSSGSFDPNGSIASYFWDFGDGATSTLANPSHTYTAKGNYLATLVVTDNSGLPGLDWANVTVTSAPPIPVINATPTWGVAPQGVILNSSGSSDPDGTIASYAWAFGDGGTFNQANPGVHTYQNAGVYNCQLTVTDNDGVPGTTTKKITVFPSNTAIYVADIAMSLQNAAGGTRTATAAVKILRFDGTPMRNANVTVQWSGLVTGTQTVKTGTNGIATFVSAKSKNSGIFTATVTNVVLSGSPYFPAANVETSDSIATP